MPVTCRHTGRRQRRTDADRGQSRTCSSTGPSAWTIICKLRTASTAYPRPTNAVVENLVAVGTIDEWVVELLSAKELAAALVQGDITRDEYREQATYAFNQVLQEVLNPPEE